MQLYVGDYFRDTRRLTCEEHGAYLLLLLTMWAEDGRLPLDDKELSKLTLLPLKRWRSIKAKILPFFDVDGEEITHGRVLAELEKSKKKSAVRAAAGAAGGIANRRASAEQNESKTKAIAPAIADAKQDGLPEHLPESRVQMAATQPAPPVQEVVKDYDKLMDLCLEAAGIEGFRAERSPKLVHIGPMIRAQESGWDLYRDILPAIRDKRRRSPTFKPRTWEVYYQIIEEYVLRGKAIPTPPPPVVENWPGRMVGWHREKLWVHAWGPQPGEAGCRVPAEFLTAPQTEESPHV